MAKAKLYKDEVMKNLVNKGVNVASFVSFGPDGKQRFCCIRGVPKRHEFEDYELAVRAMYADGDIRQVNIRTFRPDKPDGNPLFMGEKHGFENPVKAAKCVAEHVKLGYHVIVNENIDPSDGGFSGVVIGDMVEFAACDIPRCVEREGEVPCSALSRSLTRRLVRKVYGCDFVLPYPATARVEFSVHPGPVGYFGQRVTIWQAEDVSLEQIQAAPQPSWPNRYSTFLGDKAFGLLMADLHDFPVPFTRVFGRVVPSFDFGIEVHSGEGNWIRTCPKVQEPGLYTTQRGYVDPFALMHKEDPDRTKIAAIMLQQGIRADFSGAALTTEDNKLVVEGKAGRGDSFMTGSAPPDDELPAGVTAAVQSLWWELQRTFGAVRFEWVYSALDKKVWVIQLHGGGSPTIGNTIYPGAGPKTKWREFFWKNNLEEFRAFSAKAKKDGAAVRLIGNVGITSHPCDILRRDKVPSQLCRK